MKFFNAYRHGRLILVLIAAVCGILMSQAFAAESKGDVVRYSDFGARGDGKTDDFEALAKAHEHANRNGLPVRADDGARYYIGGADRTIGIETDTDFGTAEFIIDDTKLENIKANVFEIRSKLKPFKLKGVTSLKRDQARLSVKMPQDCVVIATNSKVKRFIRQGLNPNDGKSQTDVFLVERNGRVDPKTPIVWDFDEVTDITAFPVDENTLKITGGKFMTIANQAESAYNYHARGISVRRSKVVIDGLEHRVRGEGKSGAPYSGFINISECAFVMVRNTVLTGRKTYRTIGKADRPVSMGSYDFTANSALHVTLLNCTQTNDIMDSNYWGVIGTNFCKMLVYDGCVLSRFDAHMGVTNAIIRNSTLGYMGVRLTGSGTFLIENTTVRARHLIHLREDYGSTWRGDVIIRDCRFIPRGRSKSGPSILGGSNSGQHDFGYVCHMPERIVIDGLEIADGKPSEKHGAPTVFANFNPRLKDASYKQEFPYVTTSEVEVSGVSTESGKTLRLSENQFMFRDVRVKGLDVEEE